MSRAPRRLVRGRDRDPNQDYVRSLVANLECKNPLELTTAIRELTDIYVSNKYSEVFFSRDVPTKVFKATLQNSHNAKIFALGKTFLKCFMESCASQSSYIFANLSIDSKEYSRTKCLDSLLNYIISQLSDSEMLYSIYFYVLVGDIISTHHACVPFVHTLSPIHFIQVYLNKVCNNLDMCSQTTNSLSIVQLNQIHRGRGNAKDGDTSDGNESTNSGMTVASSLSLDEDCTMPTVCKQLDDALSEISSARSILSNFAETVFSNSVPGQKRKLRKETASYGKLPLINTVRSEGSSMVSDRSSIEINNSQHLDSDDNEEESGYYSQSNNGDSNTNLNSDRSRDFGEDLFDENDREERQPTPLDHQESAVFVSPRTCNQEPSLHGTQASTELAKDLQKQSHAGVKEPSQDVNIRNHSRSSCSRSSASFCEKDRLLELPALGDCIPEIPQPEHKDESVRGRPPVTRGVKVRLPPMVHDQRNTSKETGAYDPLLNDALTQESSASAILTPFNLGTISEAKVSSAELQMVQGEEAQSVLGSAVPVLNLHLPLAVNPERDPVNESSSPARQVLTTARRQSRYMIHSTQAGKGRTNAVAYGQASHNRAVAPGVKNRSSSNLLIPPSTPNGTLSNIGEPFSGAARQFYPQKDKSADFTHAEQIEKVERRAICGPLALASKTKPCRPSIVPLLSLSCPAQQEKDPPEITTQSTPKLSQQKFPGLSLGLSLDLKSVHNRESTAPSMSHRGHPGRFGDTDSPATGQSYTGLNQETADFVFDKYLQVLSERRKGIPELVDVANRIGEYTFMRDYPLLCSLSRDKTYSHGSANLTARSTHSSLSVLTTSTSQAVQANYIVNHLYVTHNYYTYLKEHKRRYLLYKLFGSTHTRDLSDYEFNFSIMSTELLPLVRLQRVDLSREDVIRLGVSYILYHCIRNLSNITLRYFPNILPSICTDLISLHQRKTGFIPAVVLALSTLVNQIHSASQTRIRSDWMRLLFKMYKYAKLTYDYIDVDTGECVPESELNVCHGGVEVTTETMQENFLVENTVSPATGLPKRKIGKRHAVTLPDDMFLLQRLEAQRRMYCIDMYTLSLRLSTLVLMPYSISACDDIACYLAVIADRLATSHANPMVRGLVTTALLPSLLKVVELFQTRRINSRLHYILIVQRILEVMSLLASDSFVRAPSLVTSPEPPVVRALVNNNVCYTTDRSMQNIDNMLCDALVFNETNLKWLRRYSCLIFLNTRIKDELSGMYYSKPQCQHSFEVYKIKFSKYIITMIRLLRYHFLKVAQQLSTNTKLETTKMFTAATHNSTHSSHIASRLVDSTRRQSFKLATSSFHAPIYITKYANLPENDYPRGLKEIAEYTQETRLKNLPMTSLATLCTLESHANIFTTARLDHIPLTRCDESHRFNVKELLRNNDCHSIIGTWSFLFDFETGVFPQYLMLAKNGSDVQVQTGGVNFSKHLGLFDDSDLLKAMPTAETVAEARTQHTSAKELLTELSKNALSAPTSRKSVLYVLYTLAEFFAIENVDLYIKPTDLRKFISFHYKSFLKLYNDCEVDLIECILSTNNSVSLLDLCNGHLNVLCSLIQMDSPNTRQYFYELRIMQFLILQLSVDNIDQNSGWQRTIAESDASTLQKINLAKAEADREWAIKVASAQAQKLLPPISMPYLRSDNPTATQDQAKKPSGTSPTKTSVFFSTPTRPLKQTAHSTGSHILANKDYELGDLRANANAVSSMIEEDVEDKVVTTVNGSQESKKSAATSLSTKPSVSAILTPGLETKLITDNSSTMDLLEKSEITDCNISDQLQATAKQKQPVEVINGDAIPSIDTLFDYHGSAVIHPLKLPSTESELMGSQQCTDRKTPLEGIKHKSSLVITAVPKRSTHIYDDDDSDSCWDDEAQKRGIELPKRDSKQRRANELEPPKADKPSDAYSSHGDSSFSDSSDLPRAPPATVPKTFGFTLKLPAVKVSIDKQNVVLEKESNSQNIAGGISQFEAAADSLNPKFHLVLGNRIAAKLETAHSLPLATEGCQAPEPVLEVEQTDTEGLKQGKQRQKQPKATKSVLKRTKSTFSSSISLAGFTSEFVRDTDAKNNKEQQRFLTHSATVAKLSAQNRQTSTAQGSPDKCRIQPVLQHGVQDPLLVAQESTLSTLSGYRDFEHGNPSELEASDLLEYSQASASIEKALHRPLYIHEELHYTILRIVLLLIIVPETGTLDPMYCSQFPANDGMPNILWILHHHLNHPRNEKFALRLISSDISPAAKRLLRLTCYTLFDSTLYPIKDATKFSLMAQGAYGSVYSGNVSLVTEDNQTNQSFLTPVAVKIQDRSKSIYDRCVLHDIFNEITVMERLANYSGVSRMYDYGVTKDGYYIIMHKYVTSLRDLRLKLFDDPATLQSNQLLYHPEPKYKHLPIYGHELSYMKYIRIYLLIFIKFLRHLEYLHTAGVNHYDIKADNVFFDPRTVQWYSKLARLDENSRPAGTVDTGTPITKIFLDKIFTDYQAVPSYELLPFRIAIADFGESMVFSDEESSYTLINKGTEYNKSPEMLLSANMVAQTRSNFDRRRPKGAGSSSDIWSAACFLYELLTGDILFFDSDWIRFFIRVTKDSYQSNVRARARDKSAAQSFTFDHSGKFAQLYRGVSLSPEKKAMLGNCQPIIDLLEFCLVPNPTLRPQIRDVIAMTEHILKVYFPETYMYKPECYYVEPAKAEPFISSSFCFSIIGSVNDCLVNPSDALAPKLSIVKKQCEQSPNSVQKQLESHAAIPSYLLATAQLTSPVLGQPCATLPVKVMPPATNIIDGFLWIGSVSVLRHAEHLLAYNVTSVIDCLTTSLEQSMETKRVIEMTTIHYYKLPLVLTQIINPTSNKTLFLGSPRESTPGLPKAEFLRYSAALDSVLDFLRRTVTHGGRCLLYDENGTGLSAAVAIAMLVEFRSLSLFAAYLHVRNLRPHIAPPLPFLDFLHYWFLFRVRPGIKNKDFLYANSSYFRQILFKPTPTFEQLINLRISKARYQCLCGKIFFIVKPDVKRMPTFVLCNCAYTPQLSKDSPGTPGKALSQPACPTLSCRSIINLFMSIYGLRLGRILWAFLPARDVVSNWKTDTMGIRNIPSTPHAIERASADMYNKFTGLDNMRAPINRIPRQRNWELYYCKICGLVTHAADASSPDAVQLAILANFSPK